MGGDNTSFSDLRRLAIETYRNEFRELSESWRNLDAKAQGLGAIAGIFLAAVFAWARDIPVGFGMIEQWILVAATLSLVATIIAAVLALKIRRTSAAPLGKTAEMIGDILRQQSKSELDQRVTALYNDQFNVWKEANEQMRKHIPTKASRIAFGQGALLFAAAMVALLAIGSVLDIL